MGVAEMRIRQIIRMTREIFNSQCERTTRYSFKNIMQGEMGSIPDNGLEGKRKIRLEIEFIETHTEGMLNIFMNAETGPDINILN